jgi:hypothetical protein
MGLFGLVFGSTVANRLVSLIGMAIGLAMTWLLAVLLRRRVARAAVDGRRRQTGEDKGRPAADDGPYGSTLDRRRRQLFWAWFWLAVGLGLIVLRFATH